MQFAKFLSVVEIGDQTVNKEPECILDEARHFSLLMPLLITLVYKFSCSFAILKFWGYVFLLSEALKRKKWIFS